MKWYLRHGDGAFLIDRDLVGRVVEELGGPQRWGLVCAV